MLLDRDGVINEMRPDYVKSVRELKLLPGAVDGIVELSRSGRRIVVVTNQSAIGQGLVSPETVDAIHRHLQRIVEERGGRIDGFLVCPHRSDESCACRKPAPGLIWRARDELGMDLASTVLVGDQPSDLEAAVAAGCDSILVTDDVPGSRPAVQPVFVAASLAAAAELIRAA